mmetsp:Transcript_23897/g.36564  ORF Transcript_23897/g.36564 Transcript_23897/m.36564 type:complete len:171 (-) Transcript_23897:12-524(-)
MPPKKDKKGKKKNKASKSKDAGEIVSPEDQIRLLQSQTSSLEFQLACKAEETTDVFAACEDLRSALAEANKKHQEEKQMTADISATMTRQFKSMQHQLLEKITERERIIQNLRDELLEAQKQSAEQLAAKERIIQQRDEEAALCRQEIEDLCKHFADLFVDASKQISSVM